MSSRQVPEPHGTIPRILMVSTAAFGVFSAVFPYMAIPCALTGLAYNLINEQDTKEIDTDLSVTLINAAEKALDAVHNELLADDTHTNSQIKIVDELKSREVLPQNLKELIKKTESFQMSYCTQKEYEHIIRLFEKNFRVQIYNNDQLSRYFTLTYQLFTREKIQIISAMLDDNKESISKISATLNRQDESLEKLEKTGAEIKSILFKMVDIISELFNELTLIMISLSVFLGISIILDTQYNLSVYIVALISYGISNLVIASLAKGEYVFQFAFTKNTAHLKMIGLIKYFISILLPIILPFLCYMLLSSGINLTGSVNLYTEHVTLNIALCLIPGSIISLIFKTIRHCSENITNK